MSVDKIPHIFYFAHVYWGQIMDIQNNVSIFRRT